MAVTYQLLKVGSGGISGFFLIFGFMKVFFSSEMGTWKKKN